MKKSSLKITVWKYFSVFSIFILAGIWLLQIVSLDSYYEYSKKNEIVKLADRISNIYNTDNYEDILDEISFDNDVCIEITSNNTISYYTDSSTKGCLGNNNREINEYKYKFMTSGDDSVLYKFNNPKFDNKTLMYSLKLDTDSYVFISTSIEPINSTIKVLKKQLIFICILILILSFIISYILSKKISKPMEEINKKSSLITKENYNVSFDSKAKIKEIIELEDTLNNMVNELSQTENLRRELLANVSHDLKTPLTIIKANSEMVKDITYNNKVKRNKNLNTIIDEADRLNLLVEDILSLSKMQSNVVKLNLDIFNINSVIKEIIDKFNVICETDNYKIIYTGFDAYIKADKTKIEQVIYNLINNAINYTGKDKKIFIKLIKDENYIKVSIIDTGSGIDSESLKYIWDKYYKLDKKYKRVTYGTGLGLSIVKNILLLHKFEYGVNTSSKGTEFYFKFREETSYNKK